MTQHEGRGPDDLEDRRAIRFGMRGDQDIIDCLVSWEALECLEGKPAANRAERLEWFERHRPQIEAAAIAKRHSAASDVSTISLGPEDLHAQVA